MQKIDRLLTSLNAWIQKAEEDDDIIKDVPDFPGLENVPGYIEEYEKKVAKLLREQKKFFLSGLKGTVKKEETEEEPTIEELLIYYTNSLFAADQFVEQFGEETTAILTATISDLTAVMMETIDKDVMFDILSERTVKWIESWATDLADLMKLNTHEAIEQVLKDGLANGESIAEIELKLKDLPQFNRKRARTTAQTEILAACSRSQWEAYNQSPAVVKKKWRHSGSRKNNTRQNHVLLDGTEVGTDDEFEIPVSLEKCQYPRDPALSGKERINCKCVLSPVVDEEILGLSQEEKEQLRQEALESMK